MRERVEQHIAHAGVVCPPHKRQSDDTIEWFPEILLPFAYMVYDYVCVVMIEKKGIWYDE